MKYKVGDKVRIREDLEVGKEYGGCLFVREQKQYLGDVMTIIRIIDENRYVCVGCRRFWSSEMFEEVDKMNETGIAIIVDGNKTVASMNGKFGEARCSPEDEFNVFVGAKLALKRLEAECKPYGWLEKGMDYYIPDIINEEMYVTYTYRDNEHDKEMKERGLVFKTKEEAMNTWDW